MEQYTKGSTNQGKSMEEGDSSGLIKVSTMESSLTIIFTDQVGGVVIGIGLYKWSDGRTYEG